MASAKPLRGLTRTSSSLRAPCSSPPTLPSVLEHHPVSFPAETFARPSALSASLSLPSFSSPILQPRTSENDPLSPSRPLLPPRHRSYDLRRGSSLSSLSAKSRHGQIAEWIIPLFVFSVLCLGAAITAFAVCLNLLEQYEDQETGFFFHVSDIHYDPNYSPESSPSISCTSPQQGGLPRPYGQSGCDSSLHLVRSAFSEMSKQMPIPDFVLATGDFLTPSLTKSTNESMTALHQVYVELCSSFSEGHPLIIPAIGETELAMAQEEADAEEREANMGQGEEEAESASAPSPPSPASPWPLQQLQRLSLIWQPTLARASDDAMQTFLRGGYYRALIPSQRTLSSSSSFSSTSSLGASSDVVVLVLNTAFLAARNSRLRHVMGGGADAGGQLAWLEEQLSQASHWGRRVVIAGHMPPGVDTWTGGHLWLPRAEQIYHQLLLRHSDVVVGQLFGFLHRDHFSLMRWTKGVGRGQGEPESENEGEGGLGSLRQIVDSGAGAGSAEEQQETVERKMDSEHIYQMGTVGERSHSVGRVEDRGAVASIEKRSEQSKNSSLTSPHHLRRYLTSTLVGGPDLSRDPEPEPLVQASPVPRSHHRRRRRAQRMQTKGTGHSLFRFFESHKGGLTERIQRLVLPARVTPVKHIDGTLLPQGTATSSTDCLSSPAAPLSVILVTPSLSPAFHNRPAFRLFRYDRRGLLNDFEEYTAEFAQFSTKVSRGRGAALSIPSSSSPSPPAWALEYSAQSLYGLDALDAASLSSLSATFFSQSGLPTETFGAFCELRAAGVDLGSFNISSSMHSFEFSSRVGPSPRSTAVPHQQQQIRGEECCFDCPHLMHCAIEYSSFSQAEACQANMLP